MTKVSQWRVARYLLSGFCVLMVPAETQHSFQLLGITPVSESPDELVARISSDVQKWKEAVANANGSN